MLKVECTIWDHHKDTSCLKVNNVSKETNKVVLRIMEYESNEWRLQNEITVDGDELMKAVRRTMNC